VGGVAETCSQAYCEPAWGAATGGDYGGGCLGTLIKEQSCIFLGNVGVLNTGRRGGKNAEG